MYKSKYYFTIFALVYSSIIYGENMLDYNKLFNSLSGRGVVEYVSEGKKTSTLAASMIKLSDVVIKGEHRCNGLLLKTAGKSMVALAVCDSGRAFICPGGPNRCKGEYFDPTNINKNVWKMHGSVGDNIYRVEWFPDHLIYRIQSRNCLIPYPHGCLVKWFGWHDSLVYIYQKSK